MLTTYLPAHRFALPARGAGFRRLHGDFDRMFDTFRRDFAAPARTTGPAIDIRQAPEAVTLTVELPGLDENDVEVEIKEDRLTISGETASETETEGDYSLRERRYGRFSRSFRLPEDIDTDGIAASFEKGLLTITLPRIQPVEPPVRKVAIKAK